MAANKLKACLVLAMCGILMPADTTAYTMEQMCQYWSSDGYIGNPNDCTSWGYCKNRQLVTVRNCDPGLVYDPHTARCDFNSSTVCTTSAVQTCNAVKSPTYVADPNNCTQFAYCNGNGGLEYASCPEGQVYSANNVSCVYGPSCPQDNICRFMKNNIFVGDPMNCGNYYQCNNGYSRSGKCQTGYYNYATGNCQLDYPSVCSGNPGNSGNNGGNTGIIPSPTKPDICTGDTDDFVVDGVTCYGFYVCSIGSTEGKWGQCPFGTHFSGTNCVSPASFACKLNRCGNLNSKFVAVAGTECKKYETCASGAIQLCPEGNPFYNEVTGFCAQTQPKMPICLDTPVL